MSFKPGFTVTHAITADLTRIERARGFLEAATLSEDWIREMSERALVREAYHTTHIEGTRLTLEESEVLLAGKTVPGADPDDVRELLNYRGAFEFVSTWLGGGGPVTEGLVREIPQAPCRGHSRRLRGTGRIPANRELRSQRGHRKGRVHAAAGVRRADPDARADRLAEPGTRHSSRAGQRNHLVPARPHPSVP